jgi:hypothetical protein
MGTGQVVGLSLKAGNEEVTQQKEAASHVATDHEKERMPSKSEPILKEAATPPGYSLFFN